MRHRVYGRHLSSDKDQRTALFKSLVRALIIHESIQTTEAKAKAVKGLIDKVITQAKAKNTRALIPTFVTDKQIQKKLMEEIAPRFEGRSSGFTSMVRLGQRFGDSAKMVRIAFVEGKSISVKAKVEKDAKKEPVSKKVLSKKAAVKAKKKE